VAARREGRAARGVRGKRGARREARGKRGARREARGATIRCRVAGRPALVASFLSPRPTRAQPRCAPIIPFIAGQWSLRGGDAAWQRHAPRGRSRAAPLSLSPSLRGSGRFAVATRRGSATPHAGAAALRPYHYPLHCGAVVASCVSPRTPGIFASGLNPLHCGAVVASVWRVAVYTLLSTSQSPSLRGSGRFHLRRGSVPARELRVSIPFIAGQWSLPATRLWTASPSRCFNPLHCGAVVASARPRRSRRWSASSFNPLHCGAVVASSSARRRAPTAPIVFQSPSLRGSGRFQEAERRARDAERFQSPSLRGSGRFNIASSRDIFGCSKNRQNRIVENSTYPLDDFGFR